MSHNLQFFYILFSALGMFASVVNWQLWNRMLDSFFSPSSPDPSIVLIIVILFFLQITLIGLMGILLPANNLLLLVFGSWSIPLFWGNEYIISGLIWVVLFMAACYGVTWSISRQAELFIRPQLFRILPGQFRNWFFLLSVILASSLILHPGLRAQQLNIEIPRSVWDQVWKYVGIPGIGDQAETNTADGEEVLGVSQQAQAFSAFPALGTLITRQVEGEVERILNEIVSPFKNYWPYIVGLSFFISAQFVAPLLSYVSFVMVEIMIRILHKLGVVELRAKDVTAVFYVLE